VIDPLISKRQQLLLATQLCRMVLKVCIIAYWFLTTRLFNTSDTWHTPFLLSLPLPASQPVPSYFCFPSLAISISRSKKSSKRYRKCTSAVCQNMFCCYTRRPLFFMYHFMFSQWRACMLLDVLCTPFSSVLRCPAMLTYIEGQ